MLKTNRRSFLASFIASPVALFAKKFVKEPKEEIIWPTTQQQVPVGGIVYEQVDYVVGDVHHCQWFPLALHPILSVNQIWIDGKLVSQEPKTFTYPMFTLPYKNL